MTETLLIIGDRAFSSWSLRGWLLFENFGLSASLRHGSLAPGGPGLEPLAAYPPARTVPTMVTSERAVVWDSLAMAEELSTRHPEAGHWPQDPAARATARSLAAEMHASFGALRKDCPMNLRRAYTDFAASEAVLQDIARIEELWAHGLSTFGGPWLCGDYSVADVFYAPVAARVAGFGLPVSERAQTYVARHLNDPAFRRWRAMGLVSGPDLPQYAQELRQRPWPGPKPLPANAVLEGPSENTTCPYSGEPVTDFLELDGRVFGFCNAFCRDKTVADPEAWPAFMALL